MKQHPIFPHADQEQAAAIAQMIGQRILLATAPLHADMIGDETIAPETLTMAVAEAHLMGAAAALTAAADSDLTSTADRAELAKLAGERLRRLMEAIDRVQVDI